MTAFERAIGDGDIAAGCIAIGVFMFGAGFDRDAIVADADITIGDAHEAARIGIDAIGVG